MRAVTGFLEDGRFTPLGVIRLPKRVQAVLVYDDALSDEGLDARKSWLHMFHNLLIEADNEEMPEFPRMQFRHELVDLTDEG